MISWFKLQSGFATNAKVARAGQDGALVFLAALCQHVQHGRAGRVPAHRLDPETLRIEAVALVGSMSTKRIAAAFARCVEVGLLRANDGHDVVIAGYDTEAMPQCVRCHNPNDDHKFSTCTECRRKRTKDTDARQGATAAQNVATCRAGQDRTGQETQSPLPPKGVRASRGGASALRRRDPERAPRAPEPEPETESRPVAHVATVEDQVAPVRDTAQPEEPVAPIEIDPVVQLQEALTQTRYREKIPALKRRFELRRQAERLVMTGFTPDDLGPLVDLAAAKGDDAGALLAHWLDSNLWREVLDEQRSRQKAAGSRERAEDSVGSTDGPIAAASVLGDVLQHAAGRVAK